LLARARAVTLTSYPEVARYAGLDPYVMLGRAGLHPSSLRDPENWLPANGILALLDESAIRSGRDDFGVLLGECRTFASLGPVSLLLKHEPTLRDVIGAMIEFRRLLNDLLHFELREDDATVVLEWNLIPGLRSSQGLSLLATIAYRILVDGSGFTWQPECVHFRQGQPRHAATFRRIFRCPIEFGSDFDGLSCNAASLALTNQFADPELAAHARRLLDLMPGIRRSDTMRERAGSTLPFLMCTGQGHVENVAKCLGLSVRTLQRRLIDEGQSFSGLLNEVRRDLVVRYLTTSSHSITEVAQLVGYSTPSSFIRWFVSEFGMPPTKWRSLMKRRDDLHLNLAAGDEGFRTAARAS
jgi:AraC-like DNA-binding protein